MESRCVGGKYGWGRGETVLYGSEDGLSGRDEGKGWSSKEWEVHGNVYTYVIVGYVYGYEESERSEEGNGLRSGTYMYRWCFHRGRKIAHAD